MVREAGSLTSSGRLGSGVSLTPSPMTGVTLTSSGRLGSGPSLTASPMTGVMVVRLPVRRDLASRGRAPGGGVGDGQREGEETQDEGGGDQDQAGSDDEAGHGHWAPHTIT